VYVILAGFRSGLDCTTIGFVLTTTFIANTNTEQEHC